MLDDSLLVNLDGLSIDPQDLRDHSAKLLATDVSPRDRLTRNLLASYAGLKANAMDARLSGNVVKALNLESECDRIYRRLPEWAKW